MFLPGNWPNWFPLCRYFLCVFIYKEEKRKEGDTKRVRDRKRDHHRSASRSATKFKVVPADALCLEPIHLHRPRFIRENTCTVLCCEEASSSGFYPYCSNIWQSKWFQKEHLHSSKQPSKQTLLKEVVTVSRIQGYTADYRYKFNYYHLKHTLCRDVLHYTAILYMFISPKESQSLRWVSKCLKEKY